MPEAIPSDLRIEISPDRLSASVCAEPSALTRPWTLEELKALCAKSALPMTPELEAKLVALEAPRKRPTGVDAIEISRGTSPVDDQPPRLSFSQAAGMVAEGDVLGQILPTQPGKDGIDVCGQPIARHTCDDAVPALSGSIRSEYTMLLANSAGYFCFEKGNAEIDPITRFDGTLPTDRMFECPKTILIAANITKGIAINAKRSLHVNGSIDSATVVVHHDLIVSGGVLGRAKGRVIVGRQMRAESVREADVIVGGDLNVRSELSQSEINCRGRIHAGDATLRGGRVSVQGGIDIGTIGNETFTKTIIEIGFDADFEKLLTEKRAAIVAGRKHVERVRTLIAPLMKNQKRLTNPQKEKATELLFEADELQAKTDQDIDQLKAAYDQMMRRIVPELVIRQAAFAGTTIRFPGIETTLRSTLKGPLRIVATGLDTRPQLHIYYGDKPTAHPLESRPIEPNPLTAMRRLCAA